MLSPAKTVRTRFRVPGEGAYELTADILPPPRASSLHAGAGGNGPGATGVGGVGAAKTAAGASVPHVAPGPLGLVGSTKVSVVEKAVLVSDARKLSSATAKIKDASSGGLSRESSASAGMFSLRKLGLSSFTSFGSGSASASTGAVLAANGMGSTAGFSDSESATVNAGGRSSVQGNGVGFSGTSSSLAPPPPVAGLNLTGTGGTGAGASGLDSVSLESHSPGWNAGDQPMQSTTGVLAHNFSDGIVVLDLAMHTGFESSPGADARQNLKVRGTPSAHALADAGGVMRLIVGCVSGEVQYWEDIGNANGRGDGRRRGGVSVGGGDTGAVTFNRDGVLNSTRVVAVRWVPGPGFRFVAVHIDGAIILYDTKHKKSGGTGGGSVGADGVLSQAADSAYFGGNGAVANGSAYGDANGVAGHARHPPNGQSAGFGNNTGSSVSGLVSGGFMNSLASITDGATGIGLSDRDREKSGLSEKSVYSSESGGASSGLGINPGHRRTLSLPVQGGQIGKHDLVITRPSRGKRINPVSMMQIGVGSIADAEFSPFPNNTCEQQYLALACRDGYLRIIDLNRELPVVSFRSYFGALLCAAWSPDGRYVATGGEDDLVSIWCPAEERIIARCEGHTSWVSAVAWDKTLCRGGRYRLGSAGQDTKLLLWDFSLDMLVTPSSHRSSARSLTRVVTGPIVPITGPAIPATTTHAPATIVSSISGSSNISSGSSGPVSAEKRPGKLARLRSHASSSASRGSGEDAEHPSTVTPSGPVIDALNRSEVPIIEPVLTHVAHVEPLTDVYFLESGVITADCVGNVKLWARPPQQHVPPLTLSASNAHLD